jgi:heme exporter protein D
MLRYSVLRLLIFFGCLALLWLLGLRDRSEQPWLVVGAALLSMVISAVALRPMRQQYIQDVSDRLRRRSRRPHEDEDVEDAATGGIERPEDTTPTRPSTGPGEEPEEYR